MQRYLSAILLVLALSTASARAAGESDAETEDRPAGASGQPVPRFVSLAADKVNLRSGPAAKYPVTWTYLKKGLPVMVTAEFEHWRRIKDVDGDEGWVHKSLLTGRRQALVVGEVRSLHRAPEAKAAIVARVEPGVIGKLEACEGTWCRLRLDKALGWLPREAIFGALPGEEIK